MGSPGHAQPRPSGTLCTTRAHAHDATAPTNNTGMCCVCPWHPFGYHSHQHTGTMLSLAAMSLGAPGEVSLWFFPSPIWVGCAMAAHALCWIQAVLLHPDTQPVAVALIM